MSPIRIGILVDDKKVPVWVAGLVEKIANDKHFLFCVIVLNASAKTKGADSSFFYRILRLLDRRLLQFGKDPFRRVDLPFLASTPTVTVNLIQSRFSDRFTRQSLDEIDRYKPDILLRFGFRILRGDILRMPKYGIWSLHHGDTAAFRGGPPAFWEVVNRSPVTGVTLQILTEKLDAGVILDKCFLRTDTTSFWRNQQKLYWAGQQLFLDNLINAAEIGLVNYLNVKRHIFSGEKPGMLYKNPPNWQAVFILLHFFVQFCFRKLRDLVFIDQWRIYYRTGDSTNIFSDQRVIQLLDPPKDRIWADPFIIEDEGGYTLFCEEKKWDSDKAYLVYFQLDGTGKILNPTPKIALQEKFHLSYPFVFKYEGGYYMTPEAGASHNVILYESSDFPEKWSPVKILLRDIRAYDPTLYQHTDGYWYLFCTVKADTDHSSNAYLHIYYSRDFRDQPFQPHPLNPIYRDVRCSRPAGKLFWDGDRLIRPAQMAAPIYGHAVVFQHVTALSPTKFEEYTLREQKPWKRNMMATHTFNHIGGLSVSDAQETRFKWL